MCLMRKICGLHNEHYNMPYLLHRGIILSDNAHNHLTRTHHAWQHPAQHLLLFHAAVIQGPCVVFQCIAVNITFLLTIFKESTGNVFLWMADTRHIHRHVSYHTSEFRKLRKLAGQTAAVRHTNAPTYNKFQESLQIFRYVWLQISYLYCNILHLPWIKNRFKHKL